MSIVLIGLSGKAAVGKDWTATNVLRPLGFRPWSLAAHFKIWLASQGRWSYEDVFFNKPPDCRADLQAEGTERGRNVHGPDIWCSVVLNWIRYVNEQWGETRFVIPDVRFANEVRAIQRAGGKVIRIHAPNRSWASSLTADQRMHQSEIDLDGVPLTQVPKADHLLSDLRFNAVVYNDVGDEAPARQMERVFDRFGWHDIAAELVAGKAA